nr:uncharacterized protein LOC129277829 [Lytechinus pictus]
MEPGNEISQDKDLTQHIPFDPYEEKLEKVFQVVKQRETRPKLIVISGLPGIGKAPFAVELAKRLQRNDSTNTIMIPVSKGASHQDVVRDITGKVLGIENLDFTVSHCLRELQKLKDKTEETIILIFGVTNAAEDELPKILSVAEDLVVFPNVTILMTSGKDFQFPRLRDTFFPYVLQPPSEAEARRYLEPFAPHLPIENYPEPFVPVLPFRVVDILKKCGQHPKLLARFADLLNSNVQISAIWDLVEENPLSILPTAEALTLTGKFGNAVIRKVKSLADKEALNALAEVDGPFDQEAFCAITGKDASQRGLAVRSIRPLLSDHLLSTADARSGRSFSMNELMKYTLNETCRERLAQSQNRFCVLYAQLFQRMTPLMHSYQPENLPLFQADFANLQKLLEMATFATSEDFMYELIMDIAHNSQEIIYDFFQKTVVVSFYESCVRAARQRSDERRLAYLLIALSHAIMMLHNKLDQVEGYLAESKEILERIGEMNSLDTVRLHMERGWYYYKCAKHQVALRSYKEAKRILLNIIAGDDRHEENLNPKYLLEKATSLDKGSLHLWVLSSVNTNIATIYTCLGNFESSASSFKQNLHLQNTLWTERHPHSALTHHKLGLMYLLSKDFANAYKYGSKGLSLRMFLTKGASHTTIQSLSMVAMAILDHSGDWKRSLTLLQEAIEMRKELGPTHPDMGLLHHSVGNVYSFCKNHKEAQRHYQQAADIRQASYGIGPNFCTIESLDALADVSLELGEVKEALEVHKKCLRMCQQHLLKDTERHLVEDGRGIDLMRTTCRKISLIHEGMDETDQAKVWKDASEAEGTLFLIPEEYLPP